MNFSEPLLRIMFEMFDSSVSLISFMRENPSRAHLKLDDIRLMANNLFYLLNKLRKRQVSI